MTELPKTGDDDRKDDLPADTPDQQPVAATGDEQPLSAEAAPLVQDGAPAEASEAGDSEPDVVEVAASAGTSAESGELPETADALHAAINDYYARNGRSSSEARAGSKGTPPGRKKEKGSCRCPYCDVETPSDSPVCKGCGSRLAGH